MERKLRVFSNTGETPSGIINDKVYFAIAGGTLAADRIQLASTFNDAAARRPITGISNGGGKLTVVSTVSDKTPGDPGTQCNMMKLPILSIVFQTQLVVGMC